MDVLPACAMCVTGAVENSVPALLEMDKDRVSCCVGAGNQAGTPNG